MFVMMVMKRTAVECVLVSRNLKINEYSMYVPTISDIDECFEETDLCEQKCTNTPGSYECSCYTGYNESRFNCIGMLTVYVQM